VGIDNFSPAIAPGWPPAINITISFEEALKLHLGLLQVLGHLNTLHRGRREGRQSAVNLCVFLDSHNKHITINKGRLE
jgi:hypothetical protein